MKLPVASLVPLALDATSLTKYFVPGVSPVRSVVTGVAGLPSTATSGVLVPYASVVPYSQCAVVAASLALTVPLSVAVVSPIAVASVVATTGGSLIVSRPMREPLDSANHSAPSAPSVMSIGPLPALRPVAYSVMTPAVVMRPIL